MPTKSALSGVRDARRCRRGAGSARAVAFILGVLPFATAAGASAAKSIGIAAAGQASRRN